MRIERVVARAFGPLQGEQLDLAEGMTVVSGPNEAGKSSWHAALRLAITGVRRGKGPGSAAERLLSERHRPWDQPDRWEVEARVHLDAGRTIDIVQDLAGKVACRATDVQLGRDVSDEIMDGTPDASRWLGLTRDTFAATVCVSQAQINAVVESADGLQHQMQRAAAARGSDATAAEAIERLEQFRRDAVGADTIAAKGPLRMARNRLVAAEAQLAETTQVHGAHLEGEAALEHADADVAAASVEQAAARAALARADALDAAARLDRAEHLTARHPSRPSGLADRGGEADEVAAALKAWELRPPAPSLDGPTSEELERELQLLPAPPDGDRAVHPDVAAARHGLEMATEARRLHGSEPLALEPDPSVDLAAVRDLARRLRSPQLPRAAAIEAQVERERAALAAAPSSWRMTLVVASILLVGGAVLGAVGAWVPATLAVIAAAGTGTWAWTAGTARRRAAGRLRRAEAALAPYREAAGHAESDRRAAATEAVAAGLPADPAALDALADALLDRQRREAEVEAWRARAASLDERVATAQRRLREALVSRGATVDGELLSAADAYATACEARRAQWDLAARAPGLRREIASRRSAEEAAVGANRARHEAESRLREVGARVGVAAVDDAELTAAALREWRAGRLEQLEEAERSLGEWHELQSILGGATLDDLRHACAAAHAAAARARAELPDGVDLPNGDRAELDRRLTAAQGMLATASATAERIRGGVAARRESMPSVSEAEEAVAAARAELDRVQRLAVDIDTSLDLLRSAEERVHRDLAPVLAGSVARWLPVVSGGAYDEVSVDPADLAISVKEAGSGRWRQARLLSEGTREQVYLLLRVAMAEHLVVGTERAPLLLDEVTAQADATRKRELLNVLHRLSAERQVILFSHDAEVVAWARTELDPGRDRLMELPALEHGVRGGRTAIAVANAAGNPALALPERVD